MNTSSKRVAIGAGLLVSLVFLLFAFRDLQPEPFWKSLRDVNLPLLLLAVPTLFLAVVIIAWRWQCLLRAVQPIPLYPLFQIVLIGYMGNSLYPLRAGEAFRAYLLRRSHQVPFASTAATILVERVFDGLVMLTFILFSLLLMDVQSAEIATITAAATPLFVGVMLILFLLVAQTDRLRQLLKFLLKILPQKLGTFIGDVSENIMAGLAGLRSPFYLMGAVVSSFLTWSIQAGVYWMVMLAFGLESNYPLALLVIGTVNLASVIPASPGQVGIYEFVVSAVLVATGIPAAAAAAYAVVMHIVIWLSVTLAGFVFLVRQGMGWADIRAARELDTATPT